MNAQLKRFWEIEDTRRLHDAYISDPCEQFFQATTKREPTGRYVVSLPRVPNPPSLGDSRALALKRFYSLEKRLARDEPLRDDYVKFMAE